MSKFLPVINTQRQHYFWHCLDKEMIMGCGQSLLIFFLLKGTLDVSGGYTTLTMWHLTESKCKMSTFPASIVTLCWLLSGFCINSPWALMKTARTNCPGLGSCQQCSTINILHSFAVGKYARPHNRHFNPCLCEHINFCPGNLENELNFSISGAFHLSQEGWAILRFLKSGKTV